LSRLESAAQQGGCLQDPINKQAKPQVNQNAEVEAKGAVSCGRRQVGGKGKVETVPEEDGKEGLDPTRAVYAHVFCGPYGYNGA
jgi:hypothetical protein